MSDQVEEIKNKLDIIDIAEEYLSPLKRSGKNFFALCPFHAERTPSFSLNQDLQIYKCFGCGESGDVLSLIQKVEGLDFPKALELAAKKAGVTLNSYRSPAQKKQAKEKQDILKLNSLVSEYFSYILNKHPSGRRGKDYLKERKISAKAVNEFQIGYAPKGFENLKKFLLKKKYSEKELGKWGILASKNGRYYDKFRDRIMFPIIDHIGDIVGFSGRVISKEDQPKYLNSPETELFHKSDILYGLHQAKESIRKSQKAIILEGQIDVISSWQCGVKNIVAPLGTALTQGQLHLLKRYTDQVVFCLDNDLAAEKALLRGVKLCHEEGLSAQAITLPVGKDVDELVRRDADLWKKISAKDEHLIDHMMRRLEERLDLNDPRQKVEMKNIVAPLIASLQEAIERDTYAQKLSLLLETDESTIRAEIARFNKQNDLKTAEFSSQTIGDSSTKRELYLLALIVQNLGLFQEVKENLPLKILDKKPFFTEILKKISTKERLTDILPSISLETQAVIQNAALMKIPNITDQERYVEELNQILLNLQKEELRKQMREIKKELKTKSPTAREETALMKKLQKLTKEYAKLP